jgi:hypothetical protein
MKVIWLSCFTMVFLAGVRAPAQDAASDVLLKHQWDLSAEGRTFLLKEASIASFLLVGGLHGDKETPALVEALWPGLRDSGYRYIVGEMSPWAAGRLKIPHLRGGDIEEPQPHLLIRGFGRCPSTKPTAAIDGRSPQTRISAEART